MLELHILAPIIMEQLRREFDKRPFRTALVTFLFCLVSIVAATYGIKNDIERQKNIELIKEKTPDFQFQLKELNEVSKSIEELSIFINKQKKLVQQQREESIKQEVAIQALNERKEELEPIVKEYEMVIKRWISLDKKEERWGWWLNMTLSFFLGIFASVVANFISKVIDNYRKGVFGREA